MAVAPAIPLAAPGPLLLVREPRQAVVADRAGAAVLLPVAGLALVVGHASGHVGPVRTASALLHLLDSPNFRG